MYVFMVSGVSLLMFIIHYVYTTVWRVSQLLGDQGLLVDQALRGGGGGGGDQGLQTPGRPGSPGGSRGTRDSWGTGDSGGLLVDPAVVN